MLICGKRRETVGRISILRKAAFRHLGGKAQTPSEWGGNTEIFGNLRSRWEFRKLDMPHLLDVVCNWLQ